MTIEYWCPGPSFFILYFSFLQRGESHSNGTSLHVIRHSLFRNEDHCLSPAHCLSQNLTALFDRFIMPPAHLAS